jgi:hypothetical protein
MKLSQRIKLFWFKLCLKFKKPNMKKGIADIIENCLRTKVLNDNPFIKIDKSTFTLDEELFQIKCDISITNLYGFNLTIDFSNINDIKYNFDMQISDGDVLLSTVNDVIPKLNQNKDFINGIIKAYFKIHNNKKPLT